MADTCCGIVSESTSDTNSGCKPSSRAARRRRMEIRRFKFMAPQDTTTTTATTDQGYGAKRQKLGVFPGSISCECEHAVGNCDVQDEKLGLKVDTGKLNTKELTVSNNTLELSLCPTLVSAPVLDSDEYPKYGVASVCGRRRDMEDAVAVCPSFTGDDTASGLHYFGVYDGHGCSHVATRCRERLHELVKQELEEGGFGKNEWTRTVEKSFAKMDKEATVWNEAVAGANCRCEMQSPECDAVGSTAVVAIVTPSKIIVANCGDSRAVLCRNGKAIPLSSDHKPDRPDELSRIQAAGGRVIFWDGPRVSGVLAMSRAIGDNYLKPHVICEPEVTITDRTSEDDCLVIASDGLWDVVSNETACGVARMCLRGKGGSAMLSAMGPKLHTAENEEVNCGGGEGKDLSDKACLDASILLTKLALARHSTDNVSVVVVDLKKDT